MHWFLPDTSSTIDFVSVFDPAVDAAALTSAHFNGTERPTIREGQTPAVFRLGAPDPYELGKVKAEFLVEENRARVEALAAYAERLGKAPAAMTLDEQVDATMGLPAPYDQTYEIIRLCLREMVGVDVPKDTSGRYPIETLRRIHPLIVQDLGRRCRGLCEVTPDLEKNW